MVVINNVDCPHPKKPGYDTKLDAKSAAKRIKRNGRRGSWRFEPYYCRCGKYHLAFLPGKQRRLPGSVTQ